MSKELRMGINAVSFNDDATKSIDQAVRANVSFVYNIVVEGLFNDANDSVEADEKAKKWVEMAFKSYFMEVLSKEPKVQWPLCGDKVEKYIKEKTIQVGIEIEAFHLQSINDDPKYKKRMEEMQEEMLSKMKGGTAKKEFEQTPESEPVAPTQPAPAENSNPFSNGMDMKKILTIIVVIILLIVGYFMK